MNLQKQKMSSRYKINLSVLFFFMTLVSMVGCNKLEENSGKLEIMGKTYLLDYLFISPGQCPGYPCYSYFEFAASEPKISVQFSIHNIWGGEIPIGTFKIGESTNKPILTDIHFLFVEDGTAGICEDEATLKISKSKENLNFSLKGKMRFGEALHDFKLTYKR